MFVCLFLVVTLASLAFVGCSRAIAPTTTPSGIPTTAPTTTPVAKTTTAVPVAPTSVSTPIPAVTTLSPIKIGALVPFTGSLQTEGHKLKKGIELALDHYNWQVAGRKVELYIEDDASDPTMALDKARKLVERDRVVLIIGVQHSGVAQAVQPYLTEKKIVCLKSREFPIPLTAKFPYIFVSGGTQKQVTAPMGEYAYNVLKYRKISTLTPDYVGGVDFVAGLVERFKELGGTIVQEQRYPVETADFGTYMTNVKDADALAAWALGSPRLVKQYGEYGISNKMPIMGICIFGLLNEEFLSQIGDTALGIKGPGTYASTVDNPLNKKVVADYVKKYNERPYDSGIVGGYVNIQVAMEALKATKGDTDPDKLKEAILKLTIETPTGPLRFTPERLGIFNVYILKVGKVGGEYLWEVAETFKDVKPR